MIRLFLHERLQSNCIIVPDAHQYSLYQHKSVFWRLYLLQFNKILIYDLRKEILLVLDVLKNAVQKSNNHQSFYFIILVMCSLQCLATYVPNSFDSTLLGLEHFWVLVDEIDENDKGLFYELIEDTFVLHDRVSDIPKEAPHILANTVLIDQQAGKAGQTLLS